MNQIISDLAAIKYEAYAVRSKVALTILFHSTCAIAVTLISKSALNGIEAPMTLLSLQTSVQVILMSIAGKRLRWINFSRPASAWNALIPLMIARLTGVLTKTFCLVHVDASLYQLSRGLLLPFTILLSWLFLQPRPRNSLTSLGGCGVVMLGFAFGMTTDVTAMLTSMHGLILGVVSSLTTSIEIVVVKRFLSNQDEGMWQMIWMTNCMACGCYLPLLLASGELATIATLFTGEANRMTIPDQLGTFLITAVMTGFAGFLLTIATFLQVSVTGPTTHMIVTAARGVAQSTLAVVLLGEEITIGRSCGMACILAGTAIYGWGKDNESQKRPQTSTFGREQYQIVDTQIQDDEEKADIKASAK